MRAFRVAITKNDIFSAAGSKARASKSRKHEIDDWFAENGITVLWGPYTTLSTGSGAVVATIQVTLIGPDGEATLFKYTWGDHLV
jgi:hypothetical protein